jgi:hypothetical protein
MALEHLIRVERLEKPQFRSCASCRHWWPARSNDGQRRFLACLSHGALLSATMPRPEDISGVLALRVCVAYDHDPAIVGPSSEDEASDPDTQVQ